jgi:hypothetical protein
LSSLPASESVDAAAIPGSAPAPRLQFNEPVTPGDVVLLVLDAQSGAPLSEVVASFDSTSRVAYSDTLGRIRFYHVPAGPLRLHLRHVGYWFRTDSLTLGTGAGLAVVVRMQPTPTILDSPTHPSSRQPPNER